MSECALLTREKLGSGFDWSGVSDKISLESPARSSFSFWQEFALLSSTEETLIPEGDGFTPHGGGDTCLNSASVTVCALPKMKCEEPTCATAAEASPSFLLLFAPHSRPVSLSISFCLKWSTNAKSCPAPVSICPEVLVSPMSMHLDLTPAN